VGRFSKRADLAALALLFTFGALLNAFGMVSPVYAFQSWLARTLGIGSEAAVLAILFLLALVIAPALLLGLAATATRLATGSRERATAIVVRHAYSLVPLGFGVWTAHYAFHFLTGLWTFVPVAQLALGDLGLSWIGDPLWSLGGLPVRAARVFELGFLALGAIGSWIVAWRIAARHSRGQEVGEFVPWAALATLLFAVAVWLLSQPMEMRGTFLG
jgi:hypothetical protein